MGVVSYCAAFAAGYLALCMLFRLGTLESFTPDECTQAIALLCYFGSVYVWFNARENEGSMRVVESMVLASIVVSIAWIRRVQLHGPHWLNSRTCSMKGKIVLVTGATSGIGLETAKALLEQGATVIVACRNEEKALKVFPQAQSNLIVMKVDLESFAGVRQFAVQFTAKFPALDVLINNAGAMLTTRKVTSDGYECMFQTNCLSPALLTLLLLKPLQRGTLKRIVNVSSSTSKAHTQVTDIHATTSFSTLGTYAKSKFAMDQFFYELARRDLGCSPGITINQLHPGAITTEINRHMSLFLRTGNLFVNICNKNAQQGARTQLFLATSSSLNGTTGKYFEHSTIHHVYRLPREDAKLHFANVERMIGCELKQCI